MTPTRTIIMGAAGRDFHNFNTFFRNNPDYEVVAFTATQIPDIEGRTYPAELAGNRLPERHSHLRRERAGQTDPRTQGRSGCFCLQRRAS